MAALQLHVVAVVGTRAEAFKLAPVIATLRRRPGVETTLILSGEQGLAPDALGGLATDADLAIDGTSRHFCAELDGALARLLPPAAPDLLLVLGDSDTAWTAAHVANRIGVPIAHAEAGLRSGHLELPWPEERNREEIDSMTALLLTPCARATRAVADLPGEICETGSSGVDAVLAALDGTPRQARCDGPRRILIAGFRRETAALHDALGTALAPIAARCDARCMVASIADATPGYAGWVRTLAASDLLLTDDGTLQEAAAVLGVPTLMLGSTTERWDAVDIGQTAIAGRDPRRILGEVEGLLSNPARHAAMARPCRAYGNGNAAERIADAIARWAATTPMPEIAASREARPALPLDAALF